MSSHDETWQPLMNALDRAADVGRRVRVWLRDDDAIEPSAALERLVRLCESQDLPIMLAVIPEPSGHALATYVRAHPSIEPAQHGYRHANHAAAGERARELGGARPTEAVFADLVAGQRKMGDLFGLRAADTLVPPWNRIDAAIVQALPSLGYSSLSAFGPVSDPVPGLEQRNCDLDIIDWRNGRVGRAPAKLVSKLVRLIDQGNHGAVEIGVLTHHLVHDDTAWHFLESCLRILTRHPAVGFMLGPSGAVQ